jgi:phospholipid:diacylglycerol acyltransferase
MGNLALIDDVLRVAAGASGAEIGGDKVYSDIFRMSERINLRLWSCCIIDTTKAYDNKEFAARLRERTNNKMELQH